ncbi:TRAP transporter substrate-binding protein [Aquibacillus sediminis]|uniref:TRAP transporter substrate-binding protein n=1 Tax=Aquibacillus sediminis TaxID=2574734 RepID=UPI0011082031|nr:TRAP transporter substrate-binding protein [Aquibacillus sediminis]
MKNMTNMISVIIIGCVLFLLAACGNESHSNGESQISTDSQNSEETLKLKSGDVVSATSPHTLGMEKFIDELDNETDGKIQVNHYPAGQLGSDSEIVEGVKLGSIDFAITGILPGSKVADGFISPYLFKNGEHLSKVIDGDVGKQIIELMESESANKGLKVIGFTYDAPRMITTKGETVEKPSDLNGFKIRVPEVSTYVDTFNTLGASPTPVAFTELYTALQTGTVNGQENPYRIIYDSSFYEVQDTVVETNHIMPARILIMNEELYDSLSSEQQQKIKDSWKKASALIKKTFEESEADYIQKLKDEGMTFIQPDQEAFQQATKDVREKYAIESFGAEIYEQIKELSN